jgi:hypothetical protein
LTRRILDAGSGEVQKRISAVCLDDILRSSPDRKEDWDRAETLGKVRAKPEDVITKEEYGDYEIIYSKNGDFPILDPAGNPPASLDWRINRHHGLVIRGETHLIEAVERAVPGREIDETFQDANREVQGRPENRKLLTALVWTARTALFLIRLFATVIG